LTTLAASDTARLLTLVGLVIAALFVATVIIMTVRKKILSADKPAATGMLMEDFRRLHASGQLSDAEFQALRTRMAAKMKASTPSKGSVHEEPAPRRATPTARPVRPARRPSSE